MFTCTRFMGRCRSTGGLDGQGLPLALSELETGIIEYSALAIALLLLVFGVALLFYLRRQGGLELSLTIMVANPGRRVVFLWGLATSLAALFGIGMADSLSVVLGASEAVAYALRTLFFSVGAVGILILMANALRTSSPTLLEGWNLQETAERVSIAATPSLPKVSGYPESREGDSRRPPRSGR